MNITEKPTAFFVCKFLFFYYIYRKPFLPFDPLVCKINNRKIPHVCVIQILGLSHYGQSVCLYVHDFFPYFYVLIPPEEKSNTNLEFELCQFLEEEYGKEKQDKTQNVCIYNIERVKKKCIYGYKEEPEEFLKIYFLYPHTIHYFANLLKRKLFKNRAWDLYEVHISYMLHFLCSKNIYGCSEIYVDRNVFFRREFFSEINFECFDKEEKWNVKNKCDMECIQRNKYIDEDAPKFFTNKTTNVNFSSLRRGTSCDIECDIRHEHILNNQIYSYEFEKYRKKWREELNFDLPVNYLDSFAKMWMKEKKRCQRMNPHLVKGIFNFDDFGKELNIGSFDVLTERTKKLFADFLKSLEGGFPVNGGTSQIIDGTSQVNDGTSQVNGGTSQVNDGTSQVNGGTSQVNDGTSQVKGGSSQTKSTCVDKNKAEKRDLRLHRESSPSKGETKMTQEKKLEEGKRKYIASFEINNKRKDIIRYVHTKKPPKIKECYAILNNMNGTEKRGESEEGTRDDGVIISQTNQEGVRKIWQKGAVEEEDVPLTTSNRKTQQKEKKKKKKMNIKYGNIFFLEILTEVKRENHNCSNFREDEIKAIFYLVRDERLMNYYGDYSNCMGIIAVQPFHDTFPYLLRKEEETKPKGKFLPGVETCSDGAYIHRDLFKAPPGGDKTEGKKDTHGEEAKDVEEEKRRVHLDLNYNNVNIHIAENEKDLIKRLIEKINFYSPLSIVSYENDKYNVGYINQRCLALNMGSFYAHISKVNDQEEFTELNNAYNKNIKGILVESLYKLSKVSNTSFENLCKHHLNVNLPSISRYTLSCWYSYVGGQSPNDGRDARNTVVDGGVVGGVQGHVVGNGLIDVRNDHVIGGEPPYYPYRHLTVRYYLKRVNLLLLIYDKIGYLKSKMNFCKYIHVDLLSLINRGSQFITESFLVKLCMRNGFLMYSPSKKEIMEQRPILHVPLVLQPKSSINFFPLMVFDFQSLYPSILIAFNICYSTCLGTLTFRRRSNAQMSEEHQQEHQKGVEVSFRRSIPAESVLEEGGIPLPRGDSSSSDLLDGLNVQREAESTDHSDNSNGASSHLGDEPDDGSNDEGGECIEKVSPECEFIAKGLWSTSNGGSKPGGVFPPSSLPESREPNDEKIPVPGEGLPNYEFIRLGVRKTPPNVNNIVNKLRRDDVLITSNNTVYVKKKKRKGICTLLLEDLLKTRIMLKRCIKIYDQKKGRKLEEIMGKLKLILNVATGYIGANFSGRMPCVDISESIICTAKNSLLYIIEYIKENYDYVKIVYGDTDSIFLLNEMNDISYTFRIAQDILENVNSILPSPMYLDFEKIYCPSLLMTKKRYFGFAYKKESDEKPTLQLKGVESMRSDQCNLVKNVLLQVYFIFYYFRNFCHLSYCCCCCVMCRNFFPNFVCSCRECNVHSTSPCFLTEMVEAILRVYGKVVRGVNGEKEMMEEEVIPNGEYESEERKNKLYDHLIGLISIESNNVILKCINYLYKVKFSFLWHIFTHFDLSLFKMEIEKMIEQDYEKIINQTNDCCIMNPNNITKICLCVKEINTKKKCDRGKCFCNVKQALLFFCPKGPSENGEGTVFGMKVFYTHLRINIKRVLRDLFNRIYDDKISYDNFIIYKKVKLGTYKGEFEWNGRKVPLPPQAVVAKKLLKMNPHLVITYKEKIPFVVTKKLKEDKIYDSVAHPSCIRGIYNFVRAIPTVEKQTEECNLPEGISSPMGNELLCRDIPQNNKKKLKEINFDYYIQNLVIPPLKRMLDLLPYGSPNLEEIFYTTKRKYNWGKGKIELFTKNAEMFERSRLNGNGLSRGRGWDISEGWKRVEGGESHCELLFQREPHHHDTTNCSVKRDDTESAKTRTQIIQSYSDVNRSQSIIKRLNKVCVHCANSEVEALACQYAVHCDVFFKKVIYQEHISRSEDKIRSLVG
ncbi:DNA polymerase zeta catalytic subunit, putative [Plasmodium knowlesi strain H]|uniref:DNA polymerase n=3 Tax=Plasmodium knowlesi TaxID=5850 RepID=A0A1A7VQC5_PLAKH|nr:DNA polymerase zeta catalytic subunit, putative [Plasmodium knowlesi strain H]OTN68308.1 DNA polymerase [Plasmodium knowlesi]CAA9987265.1 DNA polymerase zeta catalytic subunit, putative [Plasmodium knowlesi strain H]SBO24040.1 DNA polymerase zeta catalytic subunit, putative [Plasmodium knowlesi strain H]SBO26068.1 DNA polymerase zeta catalytic subunit, putative [Plasmodium knowlesi strain H]VVS76739.1 DNA polymerase zeta catalytic subunit, putative [Plasmodium knowlesi strain H]